MKKVILVILMTALFLTACAQSIASVKSNEYIGEEVVVKGEVKDAVIIGQFSGYTIIDNSDEEIFIASETVPSEGSKVRIKGTLKEVPLGFAYYIEAEE
jgi:PBP1b-binding outer membrane lipoprotein LpoB